MSKTKVLVTGAAGFIGSHLCEKLASFNYEVIGIDNFNDYYSPELKEKNAASLKKIGVKIINVNLIEKSFQNSLGTDFIYIFHCAAQPGIAETSKFETYLNNNVIATNNLIGFAKKQDNLALFVNIGTSSIYGKNVTCNEQESPKPISNYGVTKLAAEQLVLASARDKKIKACSLRLYSVYGSRERPDKLFTKLINCGLNGTTFPLFEGSLEHKRSFTHVSDIIKGIVSCIGKEDCCNTEIINLGINKEYTTKQGFDAVENILQVKIKTKILPPRKGDQSRTLAIIDKAQKLLGYNPTVTLAEGVKEQIEWAKSLKK